MFADRPADWMSVLPSGVEQPAHRKNKIKYTISVIFLLIFILLLRLPRGGFDKHQIIPIGVTKPRLQFLSCTAFILLMFDKNFPVSHKMFNGYWINPFFQFVQIEIWSHRCAYNQCFLNVAWNFSIVQSPEIRKVIPDTIDVCIQ